MQDFGVGAGDLVVAERIGMQAVFACGTGLDMAWGGENGQYTKRYYNVEKNKEERGREGRANSQS